jgi:hypothetical protein
MLNDPNVWGDPDVFRPERFLEADASQRPNPLVLLFGYGSRYVFELLHVRLRLTISEEFVLVDTLRIELLSIWPLPSIRFFTSIPSKVHWYRIPKP